MMQDLIIREFNAISKEEWDTVVLDFDGSIWYTHWMVNYKLVFNKKNNVINHSCIICNSSDEPLCVFPFFIETVNGSKQISIGEDMIFSPLFNPELSQKEQIALFEKIDHYIDTTVQREDCRLARFQIPALNRETINYYKLFEYQEDIVTPDWYIFKCDFSYILSLKDRPLSAIRANIRKSFKSLINKTAKNTNLIVLDHNNPDREIFDKYVATHYELKGKNRTLEAFEEDYNAICDGLETILICEYQDQYIGIVVLYTFNKKAVYNSAMQRYEYDKLYPNHFLMWSSIEYLHSKGYEYFHNGEQVIENRTNLVSSKEINLSYFKQAWGGELYPWIKAQKVYRGSTL